MNTFRLLITPTRWGGMLEMMPPSFPSGCTLTTPRLPQLLHHFPPHHVSSSNRLHRTSTIPHPRSLPPTTLVTLDEGMYPRQQNSQHGRKTDHARTDKNTATRFLKTLLHHKNFSSTRRIKADDLISVYEVWYIVSGTK